MKKVSLLLMVFIILPLTSLFAQQNAIWSLPPNYIKFPPLGPPSLPIALPIPPVPNTPNNPFDGYDGQISNFSHNAMQDVNGDLLFFIVDGFVYDKDGKTIGRMTIGNTTNSNDIIKGFVETLIVPEPGSCSRFYIIGTKHLFQQTHMSGELYYALLDMSVVNWDTGSKGAFIHYDPNFGTPNNQAFPFQDNVASLSDLAPNFYVAGESDLKVSMALSKIRPDNSRFLFAMGEQSLFRFKITSSGITYDNNFSFSLAAIVPQITDETIRSEMELIETSNGYRIAFSYPSNQGIVLFVGELDNNGDLASYNIKILPKDAQSNSLYRASIKGLEFSPNGQYLYITHDPTNDIPFPFKIYEVSTNNFIPLTNNINMQTQIPAFKNSQIELGKDGKLYLANENSLATIGNINNPGVGGGNLNWNNSALTISYNLNDLGNNNPNIAEYLKIFPLPDQVDGMDYVSYFTEGSLACCLANTTFSTTNNHEQGGNQNWTTSFNPFGNATTITVQDELIIKTGANITANGLTFKFAPDAKLTIEQGATFTVNGCTLTVDTQCELDAMWNGIEVNGPSNFQQSGDAGRFIANNSIIEHSYLGAHNYRTNKSGTPGVFWEDYNYQRGGVILATNTTFRNNHRGTVFFDFQNTNGLTGIDDESKFNNCIFVTDAPLNKPSLTPTVIMAHMFGVAGVNFQGCDFKNTDPSIAAHERGSGIEADNCLLSVLSCNFLDITRGVDAYSVLTSVRTTKVTNSSFNNVWRGIYLKTNNLATILNNTFDVASGNFWGESYGLYLDACNLFKVENNNFNTTHQGWIGVYVESSLGNNNNEIYRNTFSNLAAGSQAAKINSNGLTASKGLEFRCNTYTNITWVDIYVSSGRIKGFQGNCVPLPTTPANNQFSRTAFFGDLYQPSVVIDEVTYHYSSPNGYPVELLNFNQNNTSKSLCSNYQFSPATSCPVRHRRNLLQLKEDLLTEKEMVTELKEKVVQGNSSDLYDAMNNLPAGDLKNLLMSASPYLSDDVLLAYLQSNPPNGHLQQILLANSPLSNYVFEKVQNSNLPKGIKAQIANSQTGTKAIDELTTEIAYYENEVAKTRNDILRHILFEDDVVERNKEAIEFIRQESACVEKFCELINFYIADNNFVEAEIELLNLSQDTANEDLVKLYDNIIQLEQAVSIEQELNTNLTIQQSVMEVADIPLKKKEKAMAEVLLRRAKLRNYQEEVEGLNLSGSGLRLMNQEEQTTSNSKIITSNSINVYPNPTSGEVNITHNLNLENGKVTFKVYNMLGVEVLNENLTSTNNEVKINNLKSGVYFYTIIQNNQTIKTDKLMVR